MDDFFDAVFLLVQSDKSFVEDDLECIKFPNIISQNILVSIYHPLANKTSVCAADLKNESFILHRDDYSPFSLIQERELLHLLNITPENISYSHSYRRIEIDICLQESIAFITDSVPLSTPSETVKIPIADCPVSYRLAFVYKKNNTNPVLQYYVKELRQYILETA